MSQASRTTKKLFLLCVEFRFGIRRNVRRNCQKQQRNVKSGRCKKLHFFKQSSQRRSLSVRDSFALLFAIASCLAVQMCTRRARATTLAAANCECCVAAASGELRACANCATNVARFARVPFSWRSSRRAQFNAKLRSRLAFSCGSQLQVARVERTLRDFSSPSKTNKHTAKRRTSKQASKQICKLSRGMKKSRAAFIRKINTESVVSKH